MITARWQALRRDALRRSGGRCACMGDCGAHVGPCGAPIDAATFEADHILPRHPRDARIPPGPDAPANIRAVCRRCNRAKSNRVTTLPSGPLRTALLQTVAVAQRLARVGVLTAPRQPILAPHVVTIRLVPVPGHANVTQATAAEARAAINAPTARVYSHGSELRVEVPRNPRRVVPFSSMPRRGLQFGVGVDAQNRVVCVNLGDAPGCLVSGQSGSGKSEVLRVIVAHLAHAGASLVLVDCDGETFQPFARCAALACAVATDVDAAADAVARFRALMDARQVDVPHPPLALVVDESHMLDDATRATVLDCAKRGRKRSAYVVVATHRPTRDALPKVLTDQLAWRIVGRVEDAAGSKVAAGVTGAQWLAGAGDMLLAHGGHIVRMQAALGGAGDWAALAQLEAEPQPAPRIERAVDVRYVRKPDDAAVTWAVERYHATGEAPSATAIHRRFGGAMDAARRRRDAALEELATA